MAQNEVTAGVAPDEMFAVLIDPNAYPKWVVGTRQIRDVDRDWPNPGARFHHSVGVGPLETRDSTKILASRPPFHSISRCDSARSALLAFRYGSQTPAPAGAKSCLAKSQARDPWRACVATPGTRLSMPGTRYHYADFVGWPNRDTGERDNPRPPNALPAEQPPVGTRRSATRGARDRGSLRSCEGLSTD